ncbi:MAG: hypothetical protein OXJ53_12795 [Gammaproteobacteria bacterium]|nr:hypothetical protein [Gammaproteobacteria bacterium]
MRFHKLLCVAALNGVALGGCQSVPIDGEYITFLREAMVASKELREASTETSYRSDQAEQAVGAWRSAAEDEGED